MIFLSESNLQIINEFVFKSTDKDELLRNFNTEFKFDGTIYDLNNEIPMENSIIKINSYIYTIYSLSDDVIFDPEKLEKYIDYRLDELKSELDRFRGKILNTKPIDYKYNMYVDMVTKENQLIKVNKNNLKNIIKSIEDYKDNIKRLNNIRKDVNEEYSNNIKILLDANNFFNCKNNPEAKITKIAPTKSKQLMDKYCNALYRGIYQISKEHDSFFKDKLNLLEKEYRQNLKIIAKAKKIIK